MTNLRVGIDVTVLAYNQEGIGNYVTELLVATEAALAVSKNKIEFFLFCYPNQDSQLLPTAKIIEVKQFTGAFKGYRQAIAISNLTRKYSLDIVISTHTHLLSLFLGKKCYWLIHDIAPLVHPEYFLLKQNPISKIIFNWGFKLAINKTGKILTTTDFVRQELEQYYPSSRGKIDVLGAGPGAVVTTKVDTEVEQQVLDKYELEKNQYFLYFGSINPRKGVDVLLKAYDLFLKSDLEHKKVKLVVAGRKGWMYQKIFVLFAQLNLADHVVFTEYIDNVTAKVLIDNCIALINPSHYEGLGMPPLEAILLGKEVILSDIPVFQQLFAEAAHFFPVNNFSGLAATMEKVQQDPKKVSEQISKSFAAKYNWSLVATNLLSVLDHHGKNF